MNKMKIKRCVIYTRVSTDGQAEVEFNSCEAQEEKIKSYIESQDKFIYERSYNDEGFSGANLNRPSLQELFREVEEGGLDTILVYKLDRLTRSLKDFYNLIEFLDQYNVSFISITESFDTSTPAGRLFLNMMLTFAQYEREIAGERVKDKLLERAKRGMWKGGYVPFGYTKIDKKIFPEKEESKIIKKIFEIYIDTGSLAKVYQKLKSEKIKNTRANRQVAGKNNQFFTKQYIFNILRNVIYTGKIKFNDVVYQGIHEPLISETIFKMAQDTHQERAHIHKLYHSHSFGGLVRCKDCSYSMTPYFTNKHSKGKLVRYFYYRCLSTIKKDWDSCKIKQVNANKLEKFVTENIERVLKDHLYLENFVFRLNNDKNLPYQTGYALSDSEISYSVEGVKNVLSGVLKTIKNSKKPDTSILLKNYIYHIDYSNETVAVKFLYPPPPVTHTEKIIKDGGSLALEYTKKSNSEAKSTISEDIFDLSRVKSHKNQQNGSLDIQLPTSAQVDHQASQADHRKAGADYSGREDQTEINGGDTKKAGKPALHLESQKVRNLKLIGATKSLTHFFLMPFPNTISKR